MVRIIAAVFSIGSMRKLSKYLNNTGIIENVYHLLDTKGQSELPHHDTINNCLTQVDPQNLSDVRKYMADRLMRSHVFDGSRVRGKYWQVLIDGTQVHSFNRHKHCDRCLHRTHSNGKRN
jgi:hypothetical protein